MSNEILLVAVAGTFSLIGVIIGTKLTALSDKTRWQREKRAEIFAELLDEMAAASEKTLKRNKESNKSRTHEALHVAYSFLPVSQFIKKARLFLDKADRDNFEELVNEIITLEISLGADKSLQDKLTKKESDLQKLLENSLE